jgi:AbiV family abortive infection protein
VLKDENGKWPKILWITEDLWKKTIDKTIHGVLRLLESAEILLDNGGNEAISAGLYTYAVEEYGKILVLKQSKHVEGKVEIKYREKFRCHSEKFKKAIDDLPKECKTIGITGFEEGFEEGFERKYFLADFEARMDVFYCDFSDSRDGIEPIPPVDKQRLKNAINKLRALAHA